jgi:hypothetical protein
MRGEQRLKRGALCFGLAMMIAWTACGGDEEPKEDANCVSDKEYFSQKVWKPVLEQRCFSCHNVSGQAKATRLVLQPSSQTGYLDKNMAVLKDVARLEADGKKLILVKPIGGEGHKGGPVLKADSAEIKAIESMLKRFDNPSTCSDSQTVEKHFNADITLLDPQETLRRATLNLGGRLPTAEEIALVDNQGIDAMDAIVEALSQEDVFYVRIEEIFNDLFLTDKYVGGNSAVDLLDRQIFPQARWYVEEEGKDFSGEDPAFLEAARQHTNRSVAKEPLKLISYIVRNKRPFTEILTADYMLVNPFTARVYGVTGVQFADKLNPNEWQPGKIANFDHAGVLSSPMFLNRFPTTPTNRNRHRARMVYRFFLATDVMALAERPLDPTSIEDFNPTRENAQCTSCHAVIDPVAGALQNWNDRGMYVPPAMGWYQEMWKPGFGEKDLPYEDRLRGTAWLAREITADDRFAVATVINIYRGLTGLEPIQALSTDPVIYEQEVKAHDIQLKFFESVALKFRDSNYDLRVVISELIKSPYFRAKNLPADWDEAKRAAYGNTGVGRLLTPEQLNRKIKAVLGRAWDDNGRDYLMSTNNYRILYGGIDSDGVVQRITTPNGIMANVQWRMANEMACRVTAQDFVKPMAERRFFTKVERSFMPEDSNGFAIPESINAIRKNIQHLHALILGERLTLDDPEITRTYNIFYDTWREGRQGVIDKKIDEWMECRAERDPATGMDYPEDQRIQRDRDYTVRAWQAVMMYLLSDYKFLHE